MHNQFCLLNDVQGVFVWSNWRPYETEGYTQGDKMSCIDGQNGENDIER